MALRKLGVRVQNGKLPIYQLGCELCCTSMAIRVLPFDSPTAAIAGALADLARGHRSFSGLCPYPQLLRRPIDMTLQSSRAIGAISHRWT